MESVFFVFLRLGSSTAEMRKMLMIVIMMIFGTFIVLYGFSLNFTGISVYVVTHFNFNAFHNH